MPDHHIPNAAIRRAWLDTGMTSADAAKSLGLSRVALQKRAVALGLPPRKSGRRDAISSPDFVKMWAAKVLSADIAAHYGVEQSTPYQTARRMGLSPRGKATIHNRITMAQYLDLQLSLRMSEAARAEMEQLRVAEMVDVTRGRAA